MGKGQRQFALYILAATFVTLDGLIGLVKGTQDFVFFLTIETNIFVDWHNVPSMLIIYYPGGRE